MFRTLKTILFGVGALALLCAPSMTSSAQAAYPTKPIQIIVGFAPGGDADLTARVWAEFAKKHLDQPIVVVNKTGGGGLTGTLFAAKAKPDGYTLYIAQAGPNIVLPQLKQAGYSFDSFDYIARIMVANCAVVAAPDAPWKNLKDFAADAKQHPGERTFASPSAGTWLSFAMRDWQLKNDVDVKHVEFAGSPAAASAVMGGHANISFLFPQVYASMVSADKLKILAIGTKSETFPDAPTFAEQGYAGSYYGWGGIALPKGAPQEVIDKLTEVTKKVTEDPGFIKAMENMHATAEFTPGPEWIKEMKVQYDELTVVLKDLGLIK